MFYTSRQKNHKHRVVYVPQVRTPCPKFGHLPVKLKSNTNFFMGKLICKNCEWTVSIEIV